VGRSGKRGARFFPLVATARSWPDWISGALAEPENRTLVSPATVAVVAGAAPRNGTCKRSIFARCFNISIIN
jgi:hypothetical protein